MKMRFQTDSIDCADFNNASSRTHERPYNDVQRDFAGFGFRYG